jgi:hypothetical protein
VTTIPLLRDLAPLASFHPLVFPVRDGWHRHNPSITRSEDGFRCVVRIGNACIRDGRYVLEGGLPFRTENVLVELDDELTIRSVEPLRDETDPALRFPSHHRGLQDLRLFRQGERWLATAASREHNRKTVNQQLLLALDGPRITSFTALSAPEAGDQKNWMPVLGAISPTMVTHCFPTTVVAFDLERGASAPVAEHVAPMVTRGFRGGSHLLPVSDGFVCLIHEVTRVRGMRVYTHRLVHFAPDFRIDAISPAFCFQLREIEFCAGFARHDGHLIISYGENDGEALLAVVPEDQLLALLEPVDAAGRVNSPGVRTAPDRH